MFAENFTKMGQEVGKILAKKVEMPKLPDFKEMVSDFEDIPELDKYVKLNGAEYQPFDRIRDMILGREVKVLPDGSYEYGAIDPESEAGKRTAQLRQNFYDTVNYIYDISNNFLQNNKMLSPDFQNFLKVVGQTSQSIETGSKDSQDPNIIQMNTNLRKMRERSEAQINNMFDIAEQQLQQELGPEQLNSSEGMWRMANLRQQRRQMLLDNEIDINVNQAGKILDNQIKSVEAMFQPVMKQAELKLLSLQASQRQQELDMRDFESKVNALNQIKQVENDIWYKKAQLQEQKESNMNTYNLQKYNTKLNKAIFDWQRKKDVYDAEKGNIETLHQFDVDAANIALQKRQLRLQEQEAKRKAKKNPWLPALANAVTGFAGWGAKRLIKTAFPLWKGFH